MPSFHSNCLVLMPCLKPSLVKMFATERICGQCFSKHNINALRSVIVVDLLFWAFFLKWGTLKIKTKKKIRMKRDKGVSMPIRLQAWGSQHHLLSPCSNASVALLPVPVILEINMCALTLVLLCTYVRQKQREDIRSSRRCLPFLLSACVPTILLLHDSSPIWMPIQNTIRTYFCP